MPLMNSLCLVACAVSFRRAPWELPCGSVWLHSLSGTGMKQGMALGDSSVSFRSVETSDIFSTLCFYSGCGMFPRDYQTL